MGSHCHYYCKLNAFTANTAFSQPNITFRKKTGYIFRLKWLSIIRPNYKNRNGAYFTNVSQVWVTNLYKLKHRCSVEAIECPSRADRFMQKFVALIFVEHKVVLSYCITHWCLVTQWEYGTLNINVIAALTYIPLAPKLFLAYYALPRTSSTKVTRKEKKSVTSARSPCNTSAQL